MPHFSKYYIKIQRKKHIWLSRILKRCNVPVAKRNPSVTPGKITNYFGLLHIIKEFLYSHLTFFPLFSSYDFGLHHSSHLVAYYLFITPSITRNMAAVSIVSIFVSSLSIFTLTASTHSNRPIQRRFDLVNGKQSQE